MRDQVALFGLITVGTFLGGILVKITWYMVLSAVIP